MSVLRDDLTPNISLSPFAKVYQHLVFQLDSCAFKVQILNLKTTARLPLASGRGAASPTIAVPFSASRAAAAIEMPAAKMRSVPGSGTAVAASALGRPSLAAWEALGENNNELPTVKLARSLASPAFVVSNNVPSRTDVPPVNESRPASVEAPLPVFSRPPSGAFPAPRSGFKG